MQSSREELTNDNNGTTTSQFIQKLIEDQQWEELEAFLQGNPSVAHNTTFQNGWTLLHCVTDTVNTPKELIRVVAAANPHAIGTTDTRYKDMPVHFVCRNLQTSAAKLQVLLEYCTSADLLLQRNRFGGTPLHSACHHNAVLEALQALVQATNSNILRVSTFQGHHCATTLWHSYSSTIQGHLCIANLLTEQEAVAVEELPRHFQLFWGKCRYVAFQSHSATTTEDDLLHALLRCNVPIHLFRVATRLVSEEAFLTPDTNEQSAIQALLHRGSYAASICCDELPLIMAIRQKIPYVGIRPILEAYPSAISLKSFEGFYPFQLAATVGGKPLPSLETIFQLIRLQPDLLCSS